MTEEEPFGGSPAGLPPHAGRLQSEGLILLNLRDKRAIGCSGERERNEGIAPICVYSGFHAD